MRIVLISFLLVVLTLSVFSFEKESLTEQTGKSSEISQDFNSENLKTKEVLDNGKDNKNTENGNKSKKNDKNDKKPKHDKPPKKPVQPKKNSNKLTQDMLTTTVSFKHAGPTASEVYFESADGFAGYYTQNKTAISVDLRPDFSFSKVIVGDNSTSSDKWGLTCNTDNSCVKASSNQECDGGTTPAVPLSYQGTTYECTNVNAPVYFNKALDDSKFLHKTPIQLTKNAGSNWVYNNTGVLGLAPGSDFLKNVIQNYDLTDGSFDFSFNYQISDKIHRFTADKNDVFTIQMLSFGQNKDLIQNAENLKNVTQAVSVPYWTLPVNSLKLGTSSVTAEATAYIVNTANEWLALPTTEKANLISAILKALNCANEAECTKSHWAQKEDDYKSIFLTMKFNDDQGKEITLNNPLSDIVYFDESKNDGPINFSIADINNWISLGIVPSSATGASSLALGRQFILNTYLNFRVTTDEKYILQVGQLLDLGKITPLERLLLLIFGLILIAIILIALVFKICTKRRNGADGEYVRQES